MTTEYQETIAKIDTQCQTFEEILIENIAISDDEENIMSLVRDIQALRHTITVLKQVDFEI